MRKKLSVNIDVATTHRFIGETLCKLGTDFERAKIELDMYYSLTLRLKDLVEVQRAQTTLGLVFEYFKKDNLLNFTTFKTPGNYYMALYESNYKSSSKSMIFKYHFNFVFNLIR